MLKMVIRASVSLLVLLCLSVNSVLALQCNTLYVEDNLSKLYTVDSTSGAVSLVGSIGIYNVTDIAFSGSRLYGITFSKFLEIDPNTGRGRTIGNHGFSNMNALAASSNGTLYSASNGKFIKINPTTGRGQLIGNYGPGMTSSGDLAFSPNNTLFATVDRDGYNNDWLARINPTTGTATLVGDIGFRNVFGLSFKDHSLFGVTGEGIVIKINVSTGAGAFIGSNGISQWGMTTSPNPPFPWNLFMPVILKGQYE